MSTNYYLHRRGRKTLHIGKSSAGWTFGLRVYPELGLNSLADWEQAWSAPGATIRNEYRDIVTPDQMRPVVADRHVWSNYYSHRDSCWYPNNHAEPGPRGLARRVGRLPDESPDCTYDLIPWEFS